jgi:Uma2 family endonuclease
MALNPVKRFWTVDEYLAYEQETHTRYEFLNGEIFAMAGGSDNHSTISLNVGSELRTKLRGSSCRAFNSDMKVKINDSTFVYPDATVVCGEAKFSDSKRSMLINPTLVVEVLSETTANYDKGQKYDYYRSLPSVQAYLMLEQDRAHAMLYTRDKTGWHLEEYSGLEAIVPLEAVGCNLAMSEAYLNVEFE